MYAENRLMFSYLPQDVHHFDDFCCSQKSNVSLGTPSCFNQTSDYNLGEEGDLFKAPEPVIQEPFLGLDPTGLDPISAAISMISCLEDVISPQSLTISDIESSIESGQLLSEVFYECRKDLLAKDGNETPFSEVMDIKIPTLKTDEELVAEGPLEKSVSLSSLRSMDYANEALQRLMFLDFPVSDFGGMYGMRRSFSEGDIKTLGNGDISIAQSSIGLPKSINSCTSEERREKLSRYWNKKSKRNFGRKIKYACRKALADSQPRIRGRFARTEEK
ncbi:hypothetical protein CASFOL_006955 [Castilleja foliolosa]|uniref:CCT domain-containing protein n=1 Tax=Castilleja foliolosa TaxID=1961234 RepID=A0ABD3E8M9_9LAMI